MSEAHPIGPGSRVLITGAAGGFGEPTAARLRELGARVIGLDRVSEDTDVHLIACDITDDAAVTAAVDEAVSRLGGLDAVVHIHRRPHCRDHDRPHRRHRRRYQREECLR